MICPSCKKEIYENSKFCGFCGLEIDHLGKNKKNKSLCVFIFFLMVFVLIGSVLVYVKTNRDYTAITLNRFISASYQLDEILLSRMLAYYNDVDSGAFIAQKYFSDEIEQYYNTNNVSIEYVNQVYSDFRNEFVDSDFEIDPQSFKAKHIENGIRIKYTGVLTCYRTSLKKMQTSKSELCVIFNERGKIESIEEVAILEVKFTDNGN